jgi:hypothetical protein
MSGLTLTEGRLPEPKQEVVATYGLTQLWSLFSRKCIQLFSTLKSRFSLRLEEQHPIMTPIHHSV